MYTRSESFFSGHDGTKLFMQKWLPENPKAYVLITHGQGEHSDCYNRLVNGLTDLNCAFIAWDLRGHGKSQGIRGYAGDFDDYVLDYNIFLDACFALPEVKNKKIFLISHSMGGLIQTCSLSEKKHRPQVAAQILSSPLFGVAVEVPEWKDKGASLIHSFLPKITLGNEIRNSDLTRDLEVIREYETDSFRHGRISSGVYLGFKREFERAQSRANEIDLPTLLHISDNDPIVSSEQALKFFEALASENKMLKIIENGKHELYNDIVRQDVYDIVSDFVNQFIN